MSTPAKHTPGDWSLPHFARPDVGCECGYVLTDHFMGAVCTVHVSGEGDDWQKHGDNPKFEEAVANAYLIHAAPKMFDALTELKSAIEDGLCNSGTPGFDKGRLDRAMTAADATLALATPVLEREGK